MQTDYVQRFLFERLDIRGRLVSLTGAWRELLAGRDYPEPVVALLGETVTLAVLLGANQKGRGRVTLQVEGSGPLRLLVADCDSELRIRGMATYEADGRPLLGEGKMAVTLEEGPSGRSYQSLVPLEAPTLAACFERFLAQSEQIPAWLRLYADRRAACGLLLEKLPSAEACDPEGWSRILAMADRLELADSIGRQPYDLLVQLFPEELLRVFRLHAVCYRPGDRSRVEQMLRSLGRKELEAILAEHGEIRVRDEMANREYRFDRSAVEALFA